MARRTPWLTALPIGVALGACVLDRDIPEGEFDQTALSTGTGLRAEYFNNTTLTAPVAATRVDATVNFNWASGSPASGVGTDRFSARWTGQVEALFTQTYTFYTVSDDGVRLSVNGQRIIDNWTDHGPTENRGTIALTAGRSYDLRLEYYENGGGATVTLSWSSSSQPKQIIPRTQLYPPGGGTGGGGGGGASGAAGGSTGAAGTAAPPAPACAPPIGRADVSIPPP